MTRILLIFTGGTIGSAAADGSIAPSERAARELLDLFRRQHADAHTIHFTTVEPLRILSENLAPEAWTTLINAIEKEEPNRYDGVIVTHGTDTLAFTAAVLGFYFAGLGRPILLVSSNYPLAHPEANGLANFICAVEFIRQLRLPGVFVPYRNPGRITHVHRGVRLESSPQLGGDFFSVQHKHLLMFENGEFSSGAPEIPVAETGCDFPLKAAFCRRLLVIRPYPGLDYSFFRVRAGDIVLHDLYHSGTACVSAAWGRERALPAFIESCRQAGAAVYLAPALQGPDLYETAQALLAAGANMIWNMSLESAYAKLALAYGNYRDAGRIRAFLEADIAGERIQP